jgi:cell division ATPase FtsA
MSVFKKLLNQENAEDFIVLDLGLSLKLAYVKVFASENKAKILGITELNIGRDNAFVEPDELKRLAKEALNNIKTLGFRKPKKLVVALNGDSLKGKLFVSIRQRSNPEQKIDLAEFKSLLERVEWRAFEEIKRYYAAQETGQIPKIIEGLIKDIKVDGYEVPSVLGLKGKKIIISIFNYFLTRQQHAVLIDLAQDLDLRLKKVLSTARAQVMSQINDSTIKSGFVLIDIGKSSSDLAIFKDGDLRGLKTLNLGANLFIKAIEDEFEVELKAAEEIIEAYQVGTLDEVSVKKLERRLKKDMEILRNGIISSLDKFKELRPLPNLILLSGGGVRYGVVKKMLSQGTWYKNFPMRGRPRIKILVTEGIANVIDETGTLIGPESIPLVSVAGYLIKNQLESKESDQILERIVKMLNN